MKKLALFDLDGTLFNTNDINYYAYSDALAVYDKKIDYDYYCKYCNGRKYSEFLPQIINDFDIIESIHKSKKELYKKYLNKARKNEFLFDLIKRIKDEYFIVIVTTASRKNTLDLLRYFNVEDLFDDIISQEDITNPKPDPEGFLRAMNKYSKTPEDTIIFEDSEVGIEAAQKTGASVLKVVRF